MPDAAFAMAREEFYASVGRPAVAQARLFIGLMAAMLIVIIQGLVIYRLLPLKTTEAYVLAVDSSKGTVGPAAGEVRRASDYTPERPVLERELLQFVERLYAMNADYPKIVQDGQVAAYSYTRSRAAEEFKAFIDVEQPYQRQKATPGLIRKVEKKTISFQEDGKLVLIRYRTLERSVERPTPISRDWLMTLQFLRDQPTIQEILDVNPLGIFVTHFEIVEEK